MFLKVIALLALSASDTGITEITMPKIMEIIGPVVKSGISANASKIPEKMVRTGRLSVPMPALLLFFNETGCLTAMLAQNELAKADGKCLQGENVPSISDFIPNAGSSGAPEIIIMSPLYNVGALKSVNSSRDAFWDAQRLELDKLQIEIQEKNPQAKLHPVYVPFGV